MVLGLSQVDWTTTFDIVVEIEVDVGGVESCERPRYRLLGLFVPLVLGFSVQGSGFRVQGSGFRVQGSDFRVQGSGCRVQG